MSAPSRRRNPFSKVTGTYLEWYVPDPLVEQNVFLDRVAEVAELPTFEASRPKLPQPHWPKNQIAIDGYWKAWELAWKNLKKATPENGFVSNFIDTAFNDCFFMWDSSFIVMFGRYGDHAFSFQKTLDNLYCSQHPDGYICREIRTTDGTDQWNRSCYFSTGPNVLAWTEWEHFQNNGDMKRLAEVFAPLLAYHRWTRKNRSWPDGTYWTTGLGCGMDNMPRVPSGWDHSQDHAHMGWIDATFQAILSARLLVKMGEILGEAGLESEIEEVKHLSKFVNDHMWDKATGFYYDRRGDGGLMKSKSVAGFWGLLADAVPHNRIEPLTSHLGDPKSFNRHHRVPSLAADAEGYVGDTGEYWCGAIWPPTNYMVLRGLTTVGKDDLAFEIAENHHQRVMEVFAKTGTFWENYAPESSKPGTPAKADFLGWSGLAPIAVLLEYRFGLRPIDARAGKLLWDVRLIDEIGVDNYPLGPNTMLSLHCAARQSESDEPVINIQSTHPVEVEIRWKGGRKIVKA